MNKTRFMTVVAGLAALTAFGGTPTMHPYTVPASSWEPRDQALGCEKADEIVKAGGKLELGKWYTDFTTCKKYCDDNDIPLFAIWSNAGCIHCWYTDRCFVEDAFKEWVATNDAGKVIYCFMAGGDKSAPDQVGSDAYNWMWYGGGKQINAYPFVVLWWKKGEVNYRTTGSEICLNANGTQPSNFEAEKGVPARTANMIRNIAQQFKDWVPTPPYAGGYFSQTNYPYASLQAEATTKSVAVEIVRDSLAKTNQTMTIEAPGKTKKTLTVDWAANQLVQTNVVANFSTDWFVEDEDVTLTLWEAGEAMSTVKIACVAPANAAGNPLWIGRTFDFGEWTMDLEAAKSKVAQTGGKAYTLVSVQGSLWCPDCANVERNFLDVEDGKGNNRFAAWAKSKNIALVSVDIPNFNGPTESDYASPSLLSRTAYQSTLARNTYNKDGTPKETPAISGADPVLTNKMWRSGLGYLTRNGISDAEAAKVFSRNHDLVKKNTYEGGFHRPEDGNANRTGVPIFVLLRKDGSVAARLTRMAAVSPMTADKANFDAYIQRFEEMLAIADDNATEIENNYPSASNKLKLAANGGSETATLSHADQVDVFRLDGVGGNALQSIRVTGESDAQVVVSLVTTNAAGKTVSLATSGAKKLADGIELEHTFETAGSYFVEVKAADITSEAFRIESAASTFQTYTVKGSAVLVPQEDKATAKAPAGSDKVTIKLVEGDVYHIVGMESCAALEAIPLAPAGYYYATATGNAELTLTTVDGEVSYQKWVSGQVGFKDTEDEIPESYCDIDEEPYELFVKRQDGKSGAVKMTVTVDQLATTLPAERYWLVGTNSAGAVEIEWADGETGEKPVRIYVDDAIGSFTGTMTAVLTATVDSQAGDVTLVTGKERFVLYVTEEDIQAPGRVYVSGADPAFARKGVVYARETEGARLWVRRDKGSDGLVAAALTSTVGGAKYATLDPRDIGPLSDVAPELAKKYPIYADVPAVCWSSGESGEKYVKVSGIPAGRTARVTFRPIDNLKGIAASNTVTVISVADDAPGFLEGWYELNRVRYVDQNPVEVPVTNLVADGTVSFSKLSGTLPAGLKVGFVRTGDETGVLTVSGAVTAKPGTYEAVYQVREKRGRVTVNGLVTRLVITVLDPITGTVPGVPEPVAEMRKSRTFKAIPVLNEAGTRLTGLLQVTIPPTGRVSAKFTGLDGTVSYSAKNWGGWSLKGEGWELQAELASNKGGDVTMGLVANSDGSVSANIRLGGGVTYVAESDGKLWSSKAPATDWKGYYTVALRHEKVLSEDDEGVAPTGDGYVTLKMNTTSACNGGTFTLAGRLPNGTTFSGSSVLVLNGEAACLPVFRKSTKDALTAFVGIAANAQKEENRRCVEAAKPDGATPCLAYWRHTEREVLEGSYEVALLPCGSYYDAGEIGGCCAEYYETTDMTIYFDELPGAGVTVEDNRIGRDDDRPNLLLVTLSFNRATGVITGKSNHTGLGARVSYAGVVVNGWGEGCGCGPGTGPFLPLMSGSYFYRDGSLTKGGNARIDK